MARSVKLYSNTTQIGNIDQSKGSISLSGDNSNPFAATNFNQVQLQASDTFGTVSFIQMDNNNIQTSCSVGGTSSYTYMDSIMNSLITNDGGQEITMQNSAINIYNFTGEVVLSALNGIKLDDVNLYSLVHNSTDASSFTMSVLPTLVDNSSLGLNIRITGKENSYGSTQSYFSIIDGSFVKGVGSIYQISTIDSNIKSNFTSAQAVLSTDGTDITLVINGESATNIRWSITTRSQEIIT